MKEAIGGASLFTIVIIILSVFAIYVSISVNWSTAYKVKDEILFYIERNHGMNDQTIADINNYTTNEGYGSVGQCNFPSTINSACIGQFNVRTPLGEAFDNNAINYCVARFDYADTEGKPHRSYYRVQVFFQIDVPIISSLRIPIEGETSTIVNAKDNKITGTKEQCGVN